MLLYHFLNLLILISLTPIVLICNCTFVLNGQLSIYTLQVVLGEVSAGLTTTQVVVKELKASASVQEQMQFMEEVQPYRSVDTALFSNKTSLKIMITRDSKASVPTKMFFPLPEPSNTLPFCSA